MPQITNRKTTPGPPLATAAPRLLKLPAPIMAAMPKKVRSRMVSTLLRLPEPCVSSPPSERIAEIFFVRNKELDIRCDLMICIVQNNLKMQPGKKATGKLKISINTGA
jgi:hypothetical protein